MPAISTDKFPNECSIDGSWGRPVIQTETWNQDQAYDGGYFRGTMHGQGEYKWNNRGLYDGGFYSGSKHGYGVVSLPDNSFFEGLFVHNQPFGPGILTHPNGRQDVGFWVGRKLVRLSRSIDFVVPRLAPTPAGKVKLLKFRKLISLTEDGLDSVEDLLNGWRRPFEQFCQAIHDPRSVFFDKESFEKAYFEPLIPELPESATQQSSQSESFRCPTFLEDEYSDFCEQSRVSFEPGKGFLENFTEIIQNEDQFSRSSFAGENFDTGPEKLYPPKLKSWNRSELCTDMLKQIFRHRDFEEKVQFMVGKLMLGERTAFRKTGKTEKQCLDFLRRCFSGSARAVEELLCSREISSDLMDGRGNNGLMFAVATDQGDIIDVLLDYGLDVNTFNDENLTPLNLCLLRRLAKAYRISDWETAFLPPDLNESSDLNLMEWGVTESIRSLDRLFGDGTSIAEEEIPKRELSKKEKSASKIFSLKESVQVKSGSQMTVIYLKKKFKGNRKTPTWSIDRSGEVTIDSSGAKLKPKLKRSTGTLEHSRGTREHSTGTLEHSTGTREHSMGTLKHSTGTLEQSTGTLEQSTGTLDQSTGTLEQSTGAQEQSTGAPEQSVGGEEYESPTRYLFQLSPMSRASFTKGMLSEDEQPETNQINDPRIIENIKEIDKTIEKLLQRGADPNLSEVPKPSIHLALFTKDTNIVRSLLLYGASPDRQLRFSDGLLTPLHVIALLPPAPEHVDICQLLLNFGASPEEETSPEFLIFEDEDKTRLNVFQGRTPLQLLCMRPDLEYADPRGYLTKIALALGKVSNKKHFFNGHSYLSLTMLCGNLGLLKILLDSKLFDPNQTLGENLGSALHVLVSSSFQMKTLYDSSIHACDILLAAGADPLKKSGSLGNCIDYGYAEIDREKARRKISETEKKESRNSKTSKNQSRDYLKDQIKVVEYLQQTTEKKKRLSQDDKRRKIEEKSGDFGMNESSALRSSQVDDYRDSNSKRESKRGKRRNVSKTRQENEEKKKLHGDKKRKLKEKSGAGVSLLQKKTKRKALKTKLGDDEKDSKRDRSSKRKGLKSTKAKRKNEEKKKKTKVSDVMFRKERKMKTSRKVGFDVGHAKKKKKSKISEEKKSKIGRGGKDITRSERQICGDYPSTNRLASSQSAALQENLKKSLIRIFGNCMGLDPSEFLLPYVVFRNGDLYYRFQGKTTGRKEQYSLI